MCNNVRGILTVNGGYTMNETQTGENRTTNEVLTPAQAADYLQVSEASVRAMLRRGALPGRKMGRLWRLRRADLEAYLSGGNGARSAA